MICVALHCMNRGQVALLVEGVGRNTKENYRKIKNPASPSSWRAWVEIFQIAFGCWLCPVALLVEGVGRNRPAAIMSFMVSWVALLVEGVG